MTGTGKGPLAHGVDPAAIQALVDQIEGEGLAMHGLLILRGGETIAEGYWKPFHAGSMHRMYSVSKSFTSLAIGLLESEGKLSLDDPVARFFADKLPANAHPYVLAATVRDLLRMATPHSNTSYTAEDSDWVRTFFQMKPSHPPGTIFNYDTAGTTVLAALVERLSGVSLLDYLRPRLLDPIGFSRDARCVLTPEGHMWGGSGVICTLRDMARVAQVCLDGGRWQGRQLLPEAYLKQATTRQIDNGDAGYGYQIWCVPDGGFRFYGMGSQFAYCYPEKRLMIACISDTQFAGQPGQTKIDLLFRQLAGAVQEEALPADAPAEAQLAARLAALAMQPVQGEKSTPCAARVQGLWYRLHKNPMGIDGFRLAFDEKGGTFAYKKSDALHSIRFGLGELEEGRFPERYFGKRIGTISDEPYRCLASAAWVMPAQLIIYVQIVDDYLGGLRIDLSFTGDEVAVLMQKAAEWFLEDYQGFAGGIAVGAAEMSLEGTDAAK